MDKTFIMAAKNSQPNELANCKTCSVRMVLVKTRSAGPGLIRRVKRCPNCKAELRTIERPEQPEQTQTTTPTAFAAVQTPGFTT
ncbi:MAG TPA: hypothetical protein VG122_00295 [Gemmata sp.]|jgi:DNA-directed RNA polymerase subunit RPC12/RpoP|nr:hypothetical protein [Gemmata sp.]